MIIDTKDFALAVVSSSNPNLTIQEKFELYEEARSYAVEQNEIIKKQQSKDQPSVQEKIDHFKQLGL
ncbi:hypothetical protein P7D85_14660 [Enterococcus hulanensis]|uniref:Uncharacterized protein n=1 Tax=Enterococcus hulanensis TaxID=2559929 RepID=A0ABU3F1M7_9ENTE|nr:MULTISPECIES: hypothetical protein [Enterococcus]MBX8939248.1 hypothetical protein [Enterococcus gilvus]MDT2601025.1 hypothetical protein [Enterococcus hulanensis]MDT2610493.1 hypothetical protein [Enterococcus hulanensis]MDT2617220.1 hypothetical protein [Enterococcus hulanensis]